MVWFLYSSVQRYVSEEIELLPKTEAKKKPKKEKRKNKTKKQKTMCIFYFLKFTGN